MQCAQKGAATGCVALPARWHAKQPLHLRDNADVLLRGDEQEADVEERRGAEEEETAPRRHKLSHTGNLAAITSFTGDVDESVDARKLAVITSSTTSPQSMNPQCKVPNVRSAQPEETCA
eukprot:3211726-Rhodomonas_salina.3